MEDDDIGKAYSDAQPDCSVDAPNDLPNVTEYTSAAAFLKLGPFTHLPSIAINDFFFLLELHHLTSCPSGSHTDDIWVDIFLEAQAPGWQSYHRGNKHFSATEYTFAAAFFKVRILS